MRIEANYVSAKEITKELLVNTVFMSFAEGGAMGSPGTVIFFNEKGRKYTLNILTDDEACRKFIRFFPGDIECDAGIICRKSAIPDGWKYEYMGYGNHLIIRNDMAEEFKRKMENSKYQGSLINTWEDMAQDILYDTEKTRKATRQERIEVFNDTLDFIRDNDVLSQSVEYSKKNTKIYYEDDYPAFDRERKYPSEIGVTDDRSFHAAMRLRREFPEKKIAVLNFANAFHPGGGVASGASAQEECLCRCSTLYPLISRRSIKDTFYKHHYTLNTPKASDSIIYTPGVMICKTDEEYPVRMDESDFVKVDVMTMAAPDLRNMKMGNTEQYAYHIKRALHMLQIAAYEGAEILVLGAFGCGAFGNNPEIVANAYKDALNVFPSTFDRVEFAVHCNPDNPVNYEVFRIVMSIDYSFNSIKYI